MDRLIAFIATAKPYESRAFYRDVVGLDLIEEAEFSIVLASGETMLRIQKVAEVEPGTDTALGWAVESIDVRIAELTERGVRFERFEGATTDDPVWVAPDDTKVAWFRDPDGNLLSLTQFAK